MERKRKSFGYLTAQIYGGSSEHKTLGIRIDPQSMIDAVKFSRAILQAVEYGTGIDITVFKYKPLKSGKVSITVTAPIMSYKKRREIEENAEWV